MAKKKKPSNKPPPNLKPEFVYTDELKAKDRAIKKKKNAPDKPQPAWLFPPAEEHPLLNPKPQSEEKLKKDKEAHDASILFLRRQAVGAPDKAPPPGLLLNMIGAFLTSYGFDSASRLYQTQLKARNRLDDWKVEYGQPFPKGLPSLLWIYKDFMKRWEAEQLAKGEQDDTSSDETSSDDSSDDTSDEEDDSDNVEQETGKERQKTDKKAQIKAGKKTKPGNSDSSESSDSSDSFSESSETESESGNNPKTLSSKGEKTTTTTTQGKGDGTSSSSDSDAESESDSDSDDEKGRPPTSQESARPKAAALTTSEDRRRRKSSDSSSTLQNPSPLKDVGPPSSVSSSTDSDSDSDEAAPTPASGARIPPPASLSDNLAADAPSTKRKASTSPAPVAQERGDKKQKRAGERFQRIPTNTEVDPRFSSNAYQSYDYADRAHQDLSVTRGRGFTKEKNKKKRGSYRGGIIDTSGGKGVRFD